jgi:hypothetical protein
VTFFNYLGFTKPMPQPGKSLLKKQKSSEDYDALDDREEVEMITPDELGSPEQVYR